LVEDLESCQRRAAEAWPRGRTPDFATCTADARARRERELTEGPCAAPATSAEPLVSLTGEPELGRALVRLPGGVEEVAYEVVDGLAVCQGDMVLGSREEVLARDRAFRELGSTQGFTVNDRRFLWPDEEVPYEIDPAVPARLRTEIGAAIAHWNANTIARL